MLQLQLTAGNLGRAHFGYSPLSEFVTSARILLMARPPVMLRPWVARTRRALHPGDWRAIAGLVPAPPLHDAPRFFFRWSDRSNVTLDEQLEAVESSPTENLRSQLLRAWTPLSAPAQARALASEPHLNRVIVDLVRRYWTVAIEPLWPRMQGVITEDVAHRSGQIASVGLTAALNDIHPIVHATSSGIRVDKPYMDSVIGDSTPVLIPSIFIWPGLAAIHDASGRFDLLYAANGVGRVWESVGGSAETDALADLIGRGRAAILLELEVANTTTGLARTLNTSPATVSQHLKILLRSRLVLRQRFGREVFYRRSDLAESLLNAS